jgi:hypothetical protein
MSHWVVRRAADGTSGGYLEAVVAHGFNNLLTVINGHCGNLSYLPLRDSVASPASL